MNSMKKLAQALTDIANRAKLYEAAEIFGQSRSYIDSNREKLLRQYQDYWIAVHKDRVIASDKSLRDLVATLRRSGVRLEHVALELTTSERYPILL